MSEVDSIRATLGQRNIETLMRHESDHEDAFLVIRGQAHHVRWMYTFYWIYRQWLEHHKFNYTLLEWYEGPQEPWRITLSINGDYAYGWLRSEQGIHQLVGADSRADASGRPISVEVTVLPDDQPEIALDPRDLKIDLLLHAPQPPFMFRYCAVCITHLPTGVMAWCNDNTGTTLENQEKAMMLLRARLVAHNSGEDRSTSIIRSYTVKPHPFVRDHRTGQKIVGYHAVAGGGLDSHIEAALRQQISVNSEDDCSL